MNLIKSYLSAAVSVLIIFASAASFTAAESTIIGDVDGDGTVTIMDASVIQRTLSDLRSPYSKNISAGDADSDGRITIADATLIQRYAVKMIAGLPFIPNAPTEAPTVNPTDSEGWGQIIFRP